MDSAQLEAALRLTAFIGDATQFTEYTQAIILNELNDKLATVFEDIVVKARAGFWLHTAVFTTDGTTSHYRIPPRSVVGGLEKVEVGQASTGPFYKLPEVPNSISQDYRQQSAAYPYVFVVVGDVVELIPTPPAGMTVRLAYYIRPSRLYQAQNSVSGTDRGRVTAVNTVARTVTVNALPFDQSLSVPAVVTSGLQKIDVVHADGWHELPLVGATQTIAGSVFTVGGTDSMTDIAIGDYVRVQDQTDWPCLPDDFHRCLADAAAIKVLLELNLSDKANSIAENNGNDIIRFRSLLLPRVKAEPKIIGIMRRSRGYGFTPWRVS